MHLVEFLQPILGCVARVFVTLSYCLVLMRFSGLILPISLCSACIVIPQSYGVCFSETGDVSRDDLSRARFFDEFSLKVERVSAGKCFNKE